MATVKLDPDRRGYELPSVCMVCGAEATRHKSKMFSWHPSWVYLLLLAGLLPFVLVAVIMTQRRRISAPLCDQHRYHWGSRQALVLLSVLGIIGLIVGLAVLTSAQPGRQPLLPASAWLALPAALLGWIILAIIVQLGTIRPTEITSYTITLTGVSQGFVDAVDAYEETWRSGSSRSRSAGEYWGERPIGGARSSEDIEPPDDYDRARRSPP
jgi:uncharacterized membrane protein